MSNPYIAEIRMFGFNFAPRSWMFCSGQIIAIAQNTALFSILGTQYGGNGQTTFALPDLRGRTPIGAGFGAGLTPQSVGQQGGTTSVTLSTTEVPSHGHTLNCGILPTPNPAQNVATPTSQAFFGLAGPNNTYIDPVTPNTTFAPSAIGTVGASQAHENRQPYLAVNFAICVAGVFPARN